MAELSTDEHVQDAYVISYSVKKNKTLNTLDPSFAWLLQSQLVFELPGTLLHEHIHEDFICTKCKLQHTSLYYSCMPTNKLVPVSAHVICYYM